MTSLVRQRQSLTFRARTYMAFVLTPQDPVGDWIAELDAALGRSKAFFAGHAVALDLSAVQLDPPAITRLVGDLQARNIRVLGIEGLEPAGDVTALPPLLRAGRGAQEIDIPEPNAPATATATATATAPVPDAAPVRKELKAASLMIEAPVRSGQSVVFIEGDVTVLGSVGSGAEIIAGGSIHCYGTLRGQAMAGAAGNRNARIFCHRFEAELLAIGAYYRTADDIEDSLRRGPVQAWLEGDALQISAMN